eukprot:TRINITY_DN8992_c0_g1_i8.p1 TRINITY_DN8992_c0_g1~~TRINITY_DN8992_c0_g1_i8.p1  ORF type:complete len:121 (-),score=14.44 TRINITY_DN8992_c0_g1_i8:90-452(-)
MEEVRRKLAAAHSQCYSLDHENKTLTAKLKQSESALETARQAAITEVGKAQELTSKLQELAQCRAQLETLQSQLAQHEQSSGAEQSKALLALSRVQSQVVWLQRFIWVLLALLVSCHVYR